jgi:hypothetical protein
MHSPGGFRGSAFPESPLDYPLVDVPEEGRDVLAPFRRLVIPHEGVLPDIHYQQWRSRRAQPPEGARMIQWQRRAGVLQGRQCPAPAQRPGVPAPVARGDPGAGQQVKGQRAATCANESIPSPHHRVRTTPPERSIRFPYLITSHHVLPQTCWTHSFWPGPPRLVLSLHSKVGPERGLVDLRPMSLALL